MRVGAIPATRSVKGNGFSITPKAFIQDHSVAIKQHAFIRQFFLLRFRASKCITGTETAISMNNSVTRYGFRSRIGMQGIPDSPCSTRIACSHCHTAIC